MGLALVAMVGDVIPTFVRAYSYTNTSRRQPLLDDPATSVNAIFFCLVNDEHGEREPSVFPIYCKILENIPCRCAQVWLE